MAAENGKYFTPGTGGPISEGLERLFTKAAPLWMGDRTTADREIARWEHTENLGIPSARAASVEIGLAGAHVLLLIFTGLAMASLLAVFPGQRPLIAYVSVEFIVAINLGNTLHIIRWYQARRIRRRQWQEYDRGRRDLRVRTLSSDRDLLIQLAVALPVTIWVILNVRVQG